MSKRRMPPPATQLAPIPSPTSGFDRKLLAYALAGGAATAPASAAIVYSGAQNVTVNYGSSAGIDFSGVGAATDFTFYFDSTAPVLRLSATGGNQIAHTYKTSDAISYTTGASIDGTQTYVAGTKRLADYSPGPGGARSGGPFAAGTSFVGVNLPTGIGSNVNYGWIRVTVPAATTSPLTIVDWAYQNTANTAILAGDTGQSSSAVPETGSTALFSLGAAGLCLWRARKRARRA